MIINLSTFGQGGGGGDLSNYYTKAQTDEKIQEATSGTPSSQTIEQLRTDVNAISGDVENKADTTALTAVDSVVTAHTADTSIHTDATEKAAWNAKLDSSALTNYYTSAQVDAIVSGITDDIDAVELDILALEQGKVDTTEYSEDQLTIAQALNDLNNRKLDASAYTPTDLSEYYTSAQTDAAIQSAVSGKMDDDRLVVLTQQEYDALAVKDPDTLYVISDDNVLDAYMTSAQTEAAIQSAVSGKAETTALTQVASQVSSKADSSTVTALNNVVTAHTANTTIHITNQERTDWNAKQDALVSGTNIKTINNESILGSGNITIQGGGGVTSGEVQTMIDQSISGKMDTSDWQSAETTITNALFELRSDISGLFSYDSSTSALTITTI